MNKDDIIIRKVIIHILDSAVGMPVLSDRELECGPQLYDFFRTHIEKVTGSDDIKHCSFCEDSEILDELKFFSPDTFVSTSQKLAVFHYEFQYRNSFGRSGGCFVPVSGAGLFRSFKNEL